MISVLVALVALIAAAALAIDVGLVWAARTQLQNAADAAALAGAANVIDKAGPAVTQTAAEAAAASFSSQNEAVAAPSVLVDPTEVRIGAWDFDTSTFDDSVNLSDPNEVNAVDVVARLDGSPNSPVPAFMARILGRDSFDVTTQATAYIGYAGKLGEGVVELPIAIDCCKLRGPNCEQDYCQTITTNPPNACPLDIPQTEGANTVSCLQFHNTADQNACWTQFDGSDPSINTAELRELVETDYQGEAWVPMPMYVDNGDKTPVIQEIYDRMHGQGKYVGNGEGTDRYLPNDGVADSWVTVLPVINCQTDDHCATGDPATMVGVVCFEIREILVTPEKIIKGRFLCEGDSLFDQCDVGSTGTGGLDFGVRADHPVLVR
jgi:hypothetical protein